MTLNKGFEAIMTPANNDMRGTYIFPLTSLCSGKGKHAYFSNFASDMPIS